jgi:hypothetical protein
MGKTDVNGKYERDLGEHLCLYKRQTRETKRDTALDAVARDMQTELVRAQGDRARQEEALRKLETQITNLSLTAEVTHQIHLRLILLLAANRVIFEAHPDPYQPHPEDREIE